MIVLSHRRRKMSKIIKFLLSFTLLFVLTNQAISQKKVNTVQRNTWIDFVSDEGSYKVKFPFKPKRTVSNIDAAFGKSDIIQQRILAKEYLMLVGFLDFPSEINDQEEIRLRYDNSINGVTASGKNRLISEKDIDLNGYLGREAVMQSGNLNVVNRLYIIKQRFYMLQFVMPQGLPKTRQIALQNMREKFFDSFEVTNIPDAKFKPAVLPADFGVSTSGDILKSSYLGFSMRMPEGFGFFSEEALGILREIAENEAQGDESGRGGNVKLSLKKTAVLGGAINENMSSVIIAAEASFALIELDLAAKEIRKTRAKNDKITKDLFKTKIGGVEFYRLETLDKDGNKQVFLCTLREALLFQIVFTYKNDADLKLFDESLKTIKLEERKTDEAKNNLEKLTENAFSGLTNLGVKVEESILLY